MSPEEKIEKFSCIKTCKKWYKKTPAQNPAGKRSEIRAGTFPEEKIEKLSCTNSCKNFCKKNVCKKVQEYPLRKKSKNFPADIPFLLIYSIAMYLAIKILY